jgi:hypothetical protein
VTSWVSVLKLIGIEPGRLSLSAALQNATTLSFLSALFLMPVLVFIPGGAPLHFGEWAVIPFGVALLLVGLVVVADHSTTLVRVLATLGVVATLAWAGWFGFEIRWDTAGLVKVGLVSVHSLCSFALVLAGVASPTNKVSARDG